MDLGSQVIKRYFGRIFSGIFMSIVEKSCLIEIAVDQNSGGPSGAATWKDEGIISTQLSKFPKSR